MVVGRCRAVREAVPRLAGWTGSERRKYPSRPKPRRYDDLKSQIDRGVANFGRGQAGINDKMRGRPGPVTCQLRACCARAGIGSPACSCSSAGRGAARTSADSCPDSECMAKERL